MNLPSKSKQNEPTAPADQRVDITTESPIEATTKVPADEIVHDVTEAPVEPTTKAKTPADEVTDFVTARIIGEDEAEALSELDNLI